MTAKWEAAMLVVCLAILAGCRTPQPNLKPDTTKEQFVLPPMDARYETSTYPKAAFTPTDPNKIRIDDKGGAVMPARGGGSGGMSGASGMPR